jgi:Resolvase, N terminal domain
MVLIGYAHTGAEDSPGLRLQLDALRAAGCEQVFADTGSWRERPDLDRALRELRDGRDCLVVCRLDRLGRSLRDLIATVAELEERGVGRTASANTRDLVGGAVVVWGRVEAHATGVRAEHARIVGLDLPLLRRRKRRAVTQIAERLGVPAVTHRQLRSVARAHGSPLPVALRPPRSRVRRAAVDPWSGLEDGSA